MAINFPLNDINNGDSGLSARLTLNDVIEFVNSGSQWLSGSFTGSLLGTASYALNGGNIDTGSLTTTASFNSFTSSYYADSASFDSRIDALVSESLGPGVIDVDVATSASLRASTYDNGPLNDGVDATLTSNANGALGTIDSINTILNTRILVKNQSTQLQNGIYQLTQTGSSVAPFILTRTTDADEPTDFSPQIVIPSTGSINRALVFAQTTEDPTIGTSNIVYTQITSSNLFIFQSTAGTQAANQIPLYTSVARQLTPGSSTFTYNTSTGVFRIRNINYTYPSTQGANGTVLMNNGAGVLRWANNFTGSFSGSFTGSLVGTASNAVSASYAPVFPYTGSAEITGSLGVTGSLGQGNNVQAIGIFSHAEGSGTIALGDYSHAEGSGSATSVLYAHAEGLGTQAINEGAHSEGELTQASGKASHVEGYYTFAKGDYSHTEGNQTYAIGLYSHAEGSSNYAGWKGFFTSIAASTASITGGDYTSAFIGSGTVVTFDGANIYVYAYNSMSFDGTDTLIYLNDSNAVGSTIADITIPDSNLANVYVGDASHVEGYQNVSYGLYSHTEGQSNKSFGISSHAEGGSTQAIGAYSHAEGNTTKAIGQYSHAEGYNTQAIGNHSHAEGDTTISSGSWSHAEGGSTIALGDYSHAEGDGTLASGLYSHAEGRATTALGQSSHAEGQTTIALGNYSHAEGQYTIASGSAQHVSGKYNTHGDDTSLFIIGNGTSDGARSDVFRVSGSSVQITGSLYLSGSVTSVQTQIDSKADKLILTNRQTGSYTLALSDANKLVEMNSGSANDLTVPPSSSVLFDIGTQILIAQYGTGQTTVITGSGVTIRSNGGKLKLSGQYSGATLVKIDSNEWYLFGDITT